MSDNLKTAALDLAATLMWAVFPLVPREKTPLTSHGFKDATTSIEEIERTWSQQPEANIGVATGQASGIVVLDVDPPEGEASLAALIERHGELPATLESKTGRGRQLFFAAPEVEVRNSAGKLGAGLDIRGAGGYVVVPPSFHPNGSRYEWRNQNQLPVPMPDWMVELARSKQPAAARNGGRPRTSGLDTFVSDVATAVEVMRTTEEGQRNETLNRLAFRLGQLTTDGRVDGDEAEHALFDAAREAGLDTDEIERTWASGFEAGVAQGLSRQWSDYGNAERLVDRHGGDLRFSHAGRQWLIWSSQRWVPDTTAEVVRRAKDTVRAMYDGASGIEEPERRESYVKFLLRSEAEQRLQAMVQLAASEATVVIQPEDLDADPWLLNCQNGTIDLRTGELREHRREDLLTRISPVSFDPAARSERWEAFLDFATEGDEEVQSFLQRAAGYSLVGEPSEEVLFFIHGPAASGKSTLVDSLRSSLGGSSSGYATTADFETFLKRSFSGGVRNDLARLAGARVVFSSEVDDGKELAEGVLKSLTGGDTITARFLYREHFEFVPQFALWLVANHQPKVSADDEAIWRRIRVVPFTRVVPPAKRDPQLKAFLRDPRRGGPAVLAWAVQGCLDWQQQGLGEPPAVRDATAEYRGEMDPFDGFVEAMIEFVPGGWVSTQELQEALRKWLRSSAIETMPNLKLLASRLRVLGAENKRTAQKKGWANIRIKSPDDGFGRNLGG